MQYRGIHEEKKSCLKNLSSKTERKSLFDRSSCPGHNESWIFSCFFYKKLHTCAWAVRSMADPRSDESQAFTVLLIHFKFCLCCLEGNALGIEAHNSGSWDSLMTHSQLARDKKKGCESHTLTARLHALSFKWRYVVMVSLVLIILIFADLCCRIQDEQTL